MRRKLTEQVRARLELRRSSAAQKHRNRKRELKRPGKGPQADWNQHKCRLTR
ncbi:hypothetical protein KIP54_gp26 [Mycobacterium phage JewelBug]|uniref:Uncharacterized protein n=1 Tax=Mycobacterium phage JewelBug TaxID=2502450 RepID=A0A411CGP9_9CAUD|nr:hypothetical protein KIP54_gp26 [Mycobacterium phage JewelBug]QAY12967.1 hypothetical protein SEA_JEWELBUG_77 [Mycobacterium phage JewelBug]